MSLLHSNLPSDDEEDEEYNPDLDITGEPEDRPGKASGVKPSAKARQRGGYMAPRMEQDHDGLHENTVATGQKRPADPAASNRDVNAGVDDPRTEAKKARIDSLWQALNSRPGMPAASSAASGVNIAALCRTVPKRKKTDPDLLWMKSLGLLPKTASKTPLQTPTLALSSIPTGPASSPIPQAAPSAAAAAEHANTEGASSEQAVSNVAANGSAAPAEAERTVGSAARAAAAAALAAAKEAASLGASKSYGKVAVTETRKFAGKEVQVTVQVDKEKAAKAAEKKPASGFEAFLAEIDKKQKVNVLDKSKADWQEFKSADTSIEEELEAYKKSSNKYLDKVQFLKKAELREYELERDKRLASDMRTRGRL